MKKSLCSKVTSSFVPDTTASVEFIIRSSFVVLKDKLLLAVEIVKLEVKFVQAKFWVAVKVTFVIVI